MAALRPLMTGCSEGGITLSLTTSQEAADLETALRQEAEERGALSEIGRVISASLQIDEVYESFGEQVRRLVPWDRITVVTVDMYSDVERIAYVAGVELPGLAPGTLEPLEGNPVGHSVTSRTGMVLNRDLMLKYPLLEANLAGGLNSLLCTPLIWRGQPIGALILQSTADDAYTERDLGLTERVGAQISGAIANAQLYAEIQRHAQERTIVAEIGRIMASSLQIEDVSKEFQEQVRRVLAFDKLEITTVDSDWGIVRLHYSSDQIDPSQRDAGVPLAGSISERMITSRSGVLLSDAELREALAAGCNGPGDGVDWRAFLAVPLVTRDEMIGALCIYSREPGAYTGSDLALAERIASQIAGSIANAELHAALRRTADERSFVAEMWRLARPGIDIADLCEAAAARLKAIFPYDRFALTLAGPSRGTEKDVFDTGTKDSSTILDMGNPPPNPVTRKVMAGRRGLILRSPSRTSADGRGDDSYEDLPPGFLSGVSAPLVSGDEIIGALHFQSFTANAYSGRLLEVAERIGEQIGRAITLAGTNIGHGPAPGSLPSKSRVERDHSWAWRVESSGDSIDRVASRVSLGRISLLVVDSLSICRRGYASIFSNTGIDVIGDVAFRDEAVRVLAKHRPTVVLVEPHPGTGGRLEDLATLPFSATGSKLLVVADTATSTDVRIALRAGAQGFLLKTISPVGLVNAIERVVAGGTVIDPDLLTGLVDELSAGHNFSNDERADLENQLSRRDVSILSALARGHSNAEIAAGLNLSTGTVRNRLVSLYRTLGVSDRAAAASYVTRAGIV